MCKQHLLATICVHAAYLFEQLQWGWAPVHTALELTEGKVLDRSFASGNCSLKLHHVLWMFVRNVQHHPYENMVEGFSRLGCVCKFLVLNTEKLLELNSGIAIRNGDNCLPAYQTC